MRVCLAPNKGDVQSNRYRPRGQRMAEENDILAMIAALEAKRAALDNAIASLRVLVGQGDWALSKRLMPNTTA